MRVRINDFPPRQLLRVYANRHAVRRKMTLAEEPHISQDVREEGVPI